MGRLNSDRGNRWGGISVLFKEGKTDFIGNRKTLSVRRAHDKKRGNRRRVQHDGFPFKKDRPFAETGSQSAEGKKALSSFGDKGDLEMVAMKSSWGDLSGNFQVLL